MLSLTEVERRQRDWVRSQYLSFLSGWRDIAATFVHDWGYNPDDFPGLLDALEAETYEVVSDTAYEVMRRHGLRGPADPPVATTVASGGEAASD